MDHPVHNIFHNYMVWNSILMLVCLMTGQGKKDGYNIIIMKKLFLLYRGESMLILIKVLLDMGA